MSLVYAGTGVMVGVVIDGGVFETVTEVSDWAEPPSPSLTSAVHVITEPTVSVLCTI